MHTLCEESAHTHWTTPFIPKAINEESIHQLGREIQTITAGTSRPWDLIILNSRYRPQVCAVSMPTRQIIGLSYGFLQLPSVDLAELALAICHEVGHFAGGEPTKSDLPTHSVEGQADFYAMHSCFLPWLEAKNQGMLIPVSSSSVTSDPLVQQSMITAKRLLTAMALTSGVFWDSSAEIVGPRSRGITEGHSSLECRWETFKTGAACYKNGVTLRDCPRPACWYNP